MSEEAQDDCEKLLNGDGDNGAETSTAEISDLRGTSILLESVLDKQLECTKAMQQGTKEAVEHMKSNHRSEVSEQKYRSEIAVLKAQLEAAKEAANDKAEIATTKAVLEENKKRSRQDRSDAQASQKLILKESKATRDALVEVALAGFGQRRGKNETHVDQKIAAGRREGCKAIQIQKW